MIKALHAGNKKITILLDVPELNLDPRICLKHNQPCSIDRKTVFDRQKPYSAIIDDLQKKYQFWVVDLKKYFCDEKVCHAKIDGRNLYRDLNNLNLNGDAYLIYKNINLYPAVDKQY